MKCNATLTVRDTHECERPAGHPLTTSVWAKDRQTHHCDGFEWVDGAEGSTPHENTKTEQEQDQ